jgi:hypothetical protein
MSKTRRSLGEGGAYDGKLLSDVLAVFLRVVRGWYCRQAKAAGYNDVRVGSVTFCQRFGGTINVNPHFHVLQLDGVYADEEGKATPVFVPAADLEDEDVKSIVETTAQRVIGLPARRGILDGDQLDPLAEEAPLLAGVTAASVQGMIATGERAGMRVRRVLSDPAEGVKTGHLCYASRGAACQAKRKSGSCVIRRRADHWRTKRNTPKLQAELGFPFGENVWSEARAMLHMRWGNEGHRGDHRPAFDPTIFGRDWALP